MPTTLFISDLHLTPTEPHITATFLYFLDHIAKHADALYILGDFFESYVGDDDNDPFIAEIIRALAKFRASGPPIFLMHGNRDFLMGKQFAKRADITLIPDPTVITLYNQKILLMHGDNLCTDDKSHQRFRKITRNKLIQKIFLSSPLSFRKKLVNQLRLESMQHNQLKSPEIMDVNEKAVNTMLQKHRVTRMIHGHTHRPQITEKRIVLDAWHAHGNYLQINEDWHVALLNIPY